MATPTLNVRNTILAALLGTLCLPAFADWLLVSGGNDVSAYADKTTVEKSENTVKMWSLLNFTTPQHSAAAREDLDKGASPEPVTYQSVRSQREYDCSGGKVRVLWFSMFSGTMATGAVTFTDSDKGEWENIPPQSLVETLSKLACQKG